MSASKACTRCGELKPLEDYPNNRTRADGRHSQCKACHAEIYHERRSGVPTPRPPTVVRVTPQSYISCPHCRGHNVYTKRGESWCLTCGWEAPLYRAVRSLEVV